MDEPAPIIMTALLERDAFARFDALRQAHFQPERNFLSAHLTMFHHLPGTQAAEIVSEVRERVRHEEPMTARASRMHFMGRGSSIIVECPELARLRSDLAELWSHQLTRQDAQGWRAHVTVQNKVASDKAKSLYRKLDASFSPWSFSIEGVSLWWYRGGPWEKLRDLRFAIS
ncbi:MAG: 2'-5' RNA ligase family protein [Pacificimonas sp.]